MADRVILKRFEFLHDAELCASFLRNEGVPASVDDALLVGPNPLMNIAYGGIKVRISEDDLLRATALLSELDEATPSRESEPPEPAITNDEQKVRRAHAVALVGLLLGPGFFHLYALHLLSGVKTSELSDKGKRLRRFTQIFSAAIVGALAMIVGLLVTK